ncbi:hypothetical protein MY3296_010146 [Beauveria thailandica]
MRPRQGLYGTTRGSPRGGSARSTRGTTGSPPGGAAVSPRPGRGVAG